MHIAEKYAHDVRDGKVVCGELVKLAVKRYFDDLEHCYERGFYFDTRAASRAISFIQKLKHTKGEAAGKHFVLEPWQQFIVWNIFGWLRSDGSRRFRYAYTEVARKNGKTTLSAGIALYMLYADGESRAEVYSAATKRDQAKICFNDAAAIVRKTGLRDKLKVYKLAITHEATGSTMQPLSADYDTQDGLSPSCAIIDEYHAHKDNGMYDVIATGIGARRQPIIFIITTAGSNLSSPCYVFRDNAIKVLMGVNQDDSLFIMIFGLDEEEEINDPGMWVKANPNLGVSVRVDYLEEQVTKARNSPTEYVNIMTKNFNRWMQSSSVWLTDETWMTCVGEFKSDDLKGKPCYGGLDLSAVSDLTSCVLEFHENDKTQVLPFFWIPEEKMREKVQKENINYDVWVRNGFMKVTPGNVVDYDFILADLIKLREQYKIISIAYDRWNSSQMIINLQNEGFEMSEFGQGYRSMSAPIKEFERMILGKEVEHAGHPVLRWNISNVATDTDPAGNIKFAKNKVKQRIDGAVAMIMAHGEYMTAMAENKTNVYEKRGLREW